MGLFSKLNRIAADTRRAEEALYAMALQELSNQDIRPGLWAKAFADSEGDENRTRATYLKLRVQQIKDELAALDRAMHKFNKEWGDTDSTSHTADSVSPGTTSRESSAESRGTSSTGNESPPSSTPPVPDQAIDSLATTRSNPVGWVIIGSILFWLVLAFALNDGFQSAETRANSAATAAPAEVASEVRRLIQEGRASEAYGLAHRASSQQLREEAWAAMQAQQAAKSASAAAEQSRPVYSTTEPHALIPDDTDALATVAGTLSIIPAESQQQLVLNGQRLGLPESYFRLLSLTRYADQDIVLVSMNCGGSACTFLDLAFVRLFKDGRAVTETLPEFQFPFDIVERVKQGISIRGNTIDVALGLKDGMYWFASIGPRDKLSMSAVSAPIEPLSADDCRLAAEMLDYCTELRTPCEEASFREFPSNCPDAAMPLHRATSYLARHTTGLNLPAFAQACKSASELSMTPSADFIESEICSGADPSQWASDPTASSSAESAATTQ